MGHVIERTPCHLTCVKASFKPPPLSFSSFLQRSVRRSFSGLYKTWQKSWCMIQRSVKVSLEEFGLLFRTAFDLCDRSCNRRFSLRLCPTLYHPQRPTPTVLTRELFNPSLTTPFLACQICICRQSLSFSLMYLSMTMDVFSGTLSQDAFILPSKCHQPLVISWPITCLLPPPPPHCYCYILCKRSHQITLLHCLTPLPFLLSYLPCSQVLLRRGPKLGLGDACGKNGSAWSLWQQVTPLGQGTLSWLSSPTWPQGFKLC